MTRVANPLRVARFPQVYDDAATQRGIKLSVGFDFEEYVSITRATPTKTPTYPHFWADRTPIRPRKGSWTIGVDRNDEVAHLAAARRYGLSHSNLADHLQFLPGRAAKSHIAQ